MYIRGVASTTPNLTTSGVAGLSPNVAMYLDEQPLSQPGRNLDVYIVDMNRVEVLAGPQGTLFGKNASAGVVHIITKDPSEEFSGELMGGAAEGGEYRGGATVAGPITDTLGYRLSGYASDIDGWVHNFYNGEDLNSKEEWSVRGKFKWDATDTLTLRWASDYSKMDCECTATPLRSMDPLGRQRRYRGRYSGRNCAGCSR